MHIKSIKLKNGASVGSAPLRLNSPKFTVLVGPNNSGKSRLLRDLGDFCTQGLNVPTTILETIEFEPLVQTRISELLQEFSAEPRPDHYVHPGNRLLRINGNEFEVNLDSFNQSLSKPNDPNFMGGFVSNYIAHFTTNIDGEGRMRLLNNQPRGDLLHPAGAFARLLTNNKVREEVRARIYDAVGLYLAFDMSDGSQIKVRFSDVPPPDERNLSDETLNWMLGAKEIRHISDGVKAYSGITVQLAAGDPRIVLVDEPEAFLHPTLAFKLGKELGRSNDRQVFVATHSSHFLMGAISSGADVDVVRLTYSGGRGTARLLPTGEVRKLMKDPLLRSANVLSGLFHEHVIVTEADPDRAFYQEVNERLLDASGFNGIPNALFINANGKDQLHRIAKPLRALGVPTAVIADIDVLNAGGASWTNHLAGCFVPAQQHASLGAHRKNTWDNMEASGQDPKVDGGTDVLSGDEKEAAGNLLEQLEKYGFFIVPVGEVERWLPKLHVSRSKYNWLRSIFAAMGDDPSNPGYSMPEKEDVWSFVEKVGEWLRDPSRKGIPNQ